MTALEGSSEFVGKGMLWSLNQRLDQSMDDEAGNVPGMEARKTPPALTVLRFAFQSLGVVYGDLGTSPLYVFHSTFPDGIDGNDDLMGVLSLIIYSLTLIPLIKYTFIVMRANDNGEGGTFALYSLICRHAKVNMIPNQHPTDQQLTTYSCKPLDSKSWAGKTKIWLEEKAYRQTFLVILVLIGTSMVIGDGILTPAISVLSSVGGIKVNHPHISNDWIVAIASVILVGLFTLQHFGTDKVSWIFAPTVFIWFLSIGCIGVYNIIKYEPSIFRAFSPYYIVLYFIKNKKKGWSSLGGVVLSITGTEALYADLGHFSASSVQIAFTFLVFPCLLAAYMGQAAYLSKHHNQVYAAFYKSIPESVYWPMFVVATIAAVIASQATISATFSIIKQAVALGCFPRVKVVHTSKKMSGQIYIPEINWVLMVLCLVITSGFRKTVQIGNAYGIAVVTVMLVTTVLMIFIMLLVWRSNIFLVLLFTTSSFFVELVYFSSVLFKVDQGGWAPLVIAVVFWAVMYVWYYGTLKRYQFEMQSKVSMGWILGLGPSLGLVRVPGIGLIYTDLSHGVPPIFSHFITHLPAAHSVVIFVCIKYLPVNIVTEKERFLIKRIGAKDFYLYRCVVRYGYKDLHKKDDMFEDNLIEYLSRCIEENVFPDGVAQSDEGNSLDAQQKSPVAYLSDPLSSASPDPLSCASPQSNLPEYQMGIQSAEDTSTDPMDFEESFATVQSEIRPGKHVRFAPIPVHSEVADDLQFLYRAKEAGVVHIMGDVIVRAKESSNILKKISVDYIYAFLRRICRENSAVLNIPHESLFNIGQVYYV